MRGSAARGSRRTLWRRVWVPVYQAPCYPCFSRSRGRASMPSTSIPPHNRRANHAFSWRGSEGLGASRRRAAAGRRNGPLNQPLPYATGKPHILHPFSEEFSKKNSKNIFQFFFQKFSRKKSKNSQNIFRNFEIFMIFHDFCICF